MPTAIVFCLVGRKRKNFIRSSSHRTPIHALCSLKGIRSTTKGYSTYSSLIQISPETLCVRIKVGEGELLSMFRASREVLLIYSSVMLGWFCTTVQLSCSKKTLE